MKQPKGVLITELLVGFGILGLYLYIVLTSRATMDLASVLIWFVGYLTIWNKIYKFVEWNFKPENYDKDI